MKRKSRKKKKSQAKLFLFSLMVLAVLSVTGVRAVYAYLADGDAKSNDFTIGNNEIKVEENYDPPVPGKKTVKEPKAVNTGNIDCYVRGRVLLSDSRAEECFSYYTDGKAGFNSADWTEGGDGWLYYQNVLKVSEVSSPVFTHIELKEDIPEDVRNFTVDVVFESVQSAGFPDAKAAFQAVR